MAVKNRSPTFLKILTVPIDFMANTQDTHETAVILAAGFGSRLAGTVETTSIKPLTPVAGKPLIYRTIDGLKYSGHTRIIIVLGHKNDEIEQAVNSKYGGELEIIFTYNSQYHLKNGISVLAAAPYIEGIFTLTMADHILEQSLLNMANNHVPVKNGATLLVDYKVDEVFDLDDATKVKSVDDKVRHIGKQIDDYNCIDTGLFVCTTELLTVLEEFYHANGDVSLSDGIEQLAELGRMETLDIEDAFWQDVDTSEMLKNAERVLKQCHSK